MTLYCGFLLRLDISGHMIRPRLHQLHFFFAHIVQYGGTQVSSLLYVGTVTTLLYFKALTGFPASKSTSALPTSTVNNIRRRGENC